MAEYAILVVLNHAARPEAWQQTRVNSNHPMQEATAAAPAGTGLEARRAAGKPCTVGPEAEDEIPKAR